MPSFLEITDPSKRDYIVEEFVKSKKNIIQNSRSERLGDIGLQRELTKLYKPITDIEKSQLAQQQVLTKELAALPAQLAQQQETLPAIQFPRYPSIQAEADEPKGSLIELGPIATYYLRSMTSKTLTDKTFGLYDKDGKFHIGTSEVDISGDDIIIDDETFNGTFGLWELITSKKPKSYTTDDLETYTEILLKTNAIISPTTGNVKSSKGYKYNTIIKPIYEEYYQDPPLPPRIPQQSPLSPALIRVPATATLLPPKTGKGAIILPSDPNALVEMLPIRFASYKAGNTGVVNEIVSICDELFRQGILDKEQYKMMMSQVSRQ